MVEDSTSSVPGVLSIKVADGSIIRFREWGSSVFQGSAIATTPIGRLVVNGFVTSGSFLLGSQDLIITNWDYLMSDYTCTNYSFVSLTSITTAAAVTSTSLLSLAPLSNLGSYLINQQALPDQQPTLNAGKSSTAASTDLYTSLCSTVNSLIFPTSVFSQTLAVGNTLAVSQPDFCYKGPGYSTMASPTYTSTLLDGQSLPSWITFSATSTNQWTGSTSVAGTYYITLVGSFVVSGVTNRVASTFVLSSVDTPPALQYSIPSLQQKVGQSFTYSIDSNTFGDSAGNPLTLSASLYASPPQPLPVWLFFSPTNATFSGTSPTVETLNIVVYASDQQQQSASSQFTITFTNSVPAIVTSIPNMTINTMQQFFYSIKPSFYSDSDGDALSLSTDIGTIAGLYEWLRFDPASWTFSGMPPVQAVGSYTINVTVSDGYGGTVVDSFILTVNA